MKQKQLKIRELHSGTDLFATQVGDLVKVRDRSPDLVGPGLVVDTSTISRFIAFRRLDGDIEVRDYVCRDDVKIITGRFYCYGPSSDEFRKYDKLFKGVGL